MKIKLTIIVIGHNSWHYLQKNFASLEFLKDAPEFQILYVDNASTDETRAAIAYSYPNIKVINCGVNRGIAAARNIGMVNSASDYMMFLDSDTEMNKEAFFAMLNYMEGHEDVGVCSCKLLGQDGLPQASCKHFPTRMGVIKSGLHNIGLRFGLNLFEKAYSKTLYDITGSEPMEVDFVIGACQLIRKKAQIKTGFLDERIFYGPEDADFCRRLKNTGYKVVYLPNVSILHDYQRPITKKFMSRQTLSQIKGYSYFFRKKVKDKMKRN